MQIRSIRHTEKAAKGKGVYRIYFGDTDQKVKLAADEIKSLAGERGNGGTDQPAGRDSPGPQGTMVRVELELDIPMSVTLPVQVQPDPVHQPFPFLDTTLADLGIKE